MAYRIWKYPLPVDQTEFSLDLPRWPSALHVALQHDRPCLWVTVDPEQPKVPIRFCWVGTGHELPADAVKHVGTVLLADGDLVLHLFEREG